MQTVSTAWKEEQLKNFIEAEAFVEITLSVTDPTAQADATASDNGHEDFSNIADTVSSVDKNPNKYATLERNIWVLDGSSEILAEPYPMDEGYIGNGLSNNNAEFDEGNRPIITINFSKVFTSIIPGITIQWGTAYDEYADSFIITAYNGDIVVAQQNISGNTSVTSVVSLDISNFNLITIEVTRWCLPYHRARIEKILIGIDKTYTKSELISYTHSQFVDPLAAELSKNEIRFEILNLNGEYNPDNPTGAEKYLMERQGITVRYGYQFEDGIEWIRAGSFVLSEWETPQNGITASFTARDLIELMSDKYAGTTTGTLYDIAEAAFEQIGLLPDTDGNNRWTIDSSLQSITVPDNIELDYTIAEVLQLAANAACCVMYQNRAGHIIIAPLVPELTTDYYINMDNSYQNAELSLSKPLKAVNVNNGMALINVATSGETQEVENVLVSAERATTYGQWIADYLVQRRTLSGDYRADPRLDATDTVKVSNQFADNDVLITDVEYTYNGAFRGSYEGKALTKNN